MLAATAHELQQILEDCEELADLPYDATPAELLGEIALAEGHSTTIHVQRDGLSTLKIVLHQRTPTIAQLKKAIASVSLAQQKRRQREQRRAAHEDAAGRADEDGDENEQQLVVTGLAGDGAAMVCSSGELVNSALRNGHEHRTLVSWRFLWRCFALFNVDTNQPIDDHAVNGRATLTALGIENGTILKFVHRVKYFGRRRQS
ncbi:GH13106 [Drosophila grimshawi]|uniref:GH13106 n=2 Tax=Drosophila grimshawi TaxID=7222 RepID=B4JQW4_DROGR|nr:GH13106 [Drosophila grimshawi]